MLHFGYNLTKSPFLGKRKPKATRSVPLVFYKEPDGQEIMRLTELTITYSCIIYILLYHTSFRFECQRLCLLNKAVQNAAQDDSLPLFFVDGPTTDLLEGSKQWRQAGNKEFCRFFWQQVWT